MRKTDSQTSFNSGELSSLMEGRTDVKKYKAGLSLLENFHPLVAGPVRRRSGTQVVQPAVSSVLAEKSRLHPFIYSTETAYVIEMANEKFRFFRDGAHLTGSDMTTPYLTADLFDLAFTQSADVFYIQHERHQPAKVSRTGASTFVWSAINLEDGPYLNLNATDVTLTFATQALGPGNVVVASGDGFGHDLTGFHTLDQNYEGFAGRCIRWRFPGSKIWGWGYIDSHADETHVTVDIKRRSGSDIAPTTTFRLGAWGRQTNLGWPATVSFYQDRLIYASTPFEPETVWGSEGANYESFAPTTELPDVVSPISTIAADNAYTFTQSAGYTGQVNTIRWLAPASELVLGSDGGVATMSSDQTGPITPFNIFVRDNNSYGTTRIQPVRVEDFVVYVSHTREKLRGLGYNFNDQSWVSENLTAITEEIMLPGVTQLAYQREPHGSVWMVRADGQLVEMTIERMQKVVAFGRHILGGCSVRHSFTDSSVTIDADPGAVNDSSIAIASHGLTSGERVRLMSDGNLWSGVSEYRDFFVLVVDSGRIRLSKKKGGKPVRFTALNVGNHRLEVAAVVESVAVIPATADNSDHDQVWVSVLREINGSLYRSIEFMHDDFEVDGVIGDGRFLDMSFLKTGGDLALVTPVIEGSGMYLPNEWVDVFADGAYQGRRLVDADGGVLVDPVADRVLVGYAFESNAYGLTMEWEDEQGGTRGKKRRLIEVGLQFDSTALAEVGPDEDHLSDIPWRMGSDLNDNGPVLFSGSRSVGATDAWGKDSRIYVRQRRPFPLTLVSWTPWYRVSPT